MNIRYRLFFTLLAATGAVVLCMAFLLQWSVDRGFLRYVNTVEQERLETLAAELQDDYARSGSWDFFLEDPGRWLRRKIVAGDSRGTPEPSRRPPQPGFSRSPEHEPGMHQLRRLVLLDARGNLLFGSRPSAGESALRPLQHGGETIGYLGLQPRRQLTDIHQLRFVKQQRLTLLLAAAVIFLVSAGVALLLSNRLVRPVRTLAAATHRLAAGAYATRVPDGSGDELGQLARDFNALAVTLEQNERARRQWVADISHELRTPLAVLRGEIEALEDGIRPMNPEALRSLREEVLHLGRLVDDLHQLSLSDLGALTYRKSDLDLISLMAALADSFRIEAERRGLALQVQLPEGPVMLFADPERLRQLLVNLLDNAIKYTDVGGRIAFSLDLPPGEAVIDLHDTPPGVPAADMEKLFERFYRVEGSRSRSTGGTGLGLSICRNIVEAHGGSLQARPSPLGGLWIEVRLPRGKETK